ncbi:MAG: mechanosensitive ion channel [Acaryochloridaceae cyanobacterium SU_2_1]|nr:mechanosensitive ion channel [Acaryochloridaceae cyanobacterium SU_2_1]
MNDILQTVSQELGKSVPNLLGAFAILLGGVIVALIAKWLTQTLLSKTDLDNRIAGWIAGTNSASAIANIEKWIASVVFWLIMLFVLVGFLQALQLRAVSEPLNDLLKQIFVFIPKIGGAALLLGVAWLLATVAKMILVRTLETFGLDQRLNSSTGPADTTGSQQLQLSETLGTALYWFIFLLFLLPILETLSLQGPLQPIQLMVQDVLRYLPNILGAFLIGVAGWFVARILRTIVTNLLSASGADRLGEQFGLSRAMGGQGLSALAGSLVYIFVLIPVAISAFQALGIEAISGPAIDMLRQVLNSIPKMLTAAVILGVAYVLGKIIGDLVAGLLANLGFNNVFQWLGLQAAQSPSASSPELSASSPSSPSSVGEIVRKTPSEIAGTVVLVGIVLVFLIPATDVLQFQPLTGVITELLRVLAQVLVGVLVFGVGLYLANLAFNLLASSGGAQARMVAQAARIAIIALVTAMALQQMGIASNIVNLAFGLLLGAISVALALAFGFGSMDIAGEQVRKWRDDFQSKQ